MTKFDMSLFNAPHIYPLVEHNSDISITAAHESLKSYTMVSSTRSKNWKEKVTPQQTLKRVRENQRRHRARRRDYIATLEAKLDESKHTVVALQNQVNALQAEVTQCRRVPTRNAIPILPSRDASPTLDVDLEPGCYLRNGQDVIETIRCSTENCSRTPGKLQNTPLSNFEPAMESQFKDITNGESTMLCEEAYQLIEQQNFKGVEEGDVVTWLRGGFRKSFRPSEGCRVKTDLLFSLLAFISDG